VAEILEPPLDEGEGRDLMVVKMLLGVVPGVGGALAEFVGHVHNNVARRQEAWMQEVSTAINELRGTLGLTTEQLTANQAFVSFVLQATPIALRTHRTEKLRALKSALVSVGSPTGPDEDLATQFLRYIDELTPSHLKILQAVQTRADVFGAVITMELAIQHLSSSVSHASTPDTRFAIRTYLHDLNARGLVNASDLQELLEFESRAGYVQVEQSDRTPLQVTDLGKRFLVFITSEAPPQPEVPSRSPSETGLDATSDAASTAVAP
jgi:hypothetical protein